MPYHCRKIVLALHLILLISLSYAVIEQMERESNFNKMMSMNNVLDDEAGLLFSSNIILRKNEMISETGRYESEISNAMFSTGSIASENGIMEGQRRLKASKKPEVVKTVLQRCRDSGEAYAASLLMTREHLVYQFTGYNLTWVNCEMGSFIYMNGRANPHKNVNGSLLQSVDVLDFSVIHLSTYERLMKRWARSINSRDVSLGNIEPVVQSAEMLKRYALQKRQADIPVADYRLNKTVVIMPFLGSDMGAGHSKLSNRFQYLAACFWSFYAEYNHVVAAVKSDRDRYFARNVSGLPFYDVMLLENLPKSASLPVATSQETKRRIMTGQWDFDYIFFTESDQILMMRITNQLYDYLDENPRHLNIPHRLMAYPKDIVTMFHKRALSQHHPLDWVDMQCCMPRQFCQERTNWLHISDPGVPILNVYGIQVPLGNADFHRERYRACVLHESAGLEYCP